MARVDQSRGINRRGLLIGGGAGIGLLLAWELWPRTYAPNVATVPGETLLDAFLKIDTAGRVTVVVPQAEMGQGVWTALPQALADELGADWRQVAVEPAPIDPLYANRLVAGDYGADHAPAALRSLGTWSAERWATDHAFMVTAGSTSIRAFEAPFRAAGATARALLCMAAAKRLGVDWQACDTEAGFVVRGEDRFRFGVLAAEAAAFAPPGTPPLRKPGEGGISGRSMPRVDVPAKVDGSARFAGDVRLPGLLHARILHGPLGDTRLASQDMAAAERVWGVSGVVRGPDWVAALANNGWAAEQALEKMRPRFATAGALSDTGTIGQALDSALAGDAAAIVRIGKPGPLLAGSGVIEAVYETPLQAHATVEPLVATARLDGDRLEIWLPTQAPGLARDAIARATGIAATRITLYPMLVGGGFGRKLEQDAGVQAAILAIRAKRPVQLMWGRGEELRRGRHAPPAKARLRARLGQGGQIAAFHARIAAPASTGRAAARLVGAHGSQRAEAAATAGALPPYAVAHALIEHAPADLGIETGIGRGGAHAYTGFFVESFVDELAQAAAQDALTFRMGLLAGAPRLARCLSHAAATGGWSGEAQAGEGLAACSAFGSHIGLYVEAAKDGDRIKVSRMAAAVDAGRLINPDIVRQQIESGLIWGLAAAMGDRITLTRGVADQTGLDALALPRLKDMPEIQVELIGSGETPGGVAELAVPVAAPAIANAIASATGRRLRSLPLVAA